MTVQRFTCSLNPSSLFRPTNLEAHFPSAYPIEREPFRKRLVTKRLACNVQCLTRWHVRPHVGSDRFDSGEQTK